MNNNEFIKKGIVENESESNIVKTASDEVMDKVKLCKLGCKCRCRTNNSKEETKNENSQ